jgi:hypothetical protein
VKKAKQVGALFGGKRRADGYEKPYGSFSGGLKGPSEERAKGEPSEQHSFGRLIGERYLKGQKSHESTRSRSELILRNAFRDTAFLVRPNRSSIGARPHRFCNEIQKRKDESERIYRSLERRNALKGETQERWRLKKIS